jgi:hypothetical protein
MHALVIALFMVVASPTERSQVLHTVFASFLASPAQCPNIPGLEGAGTWGQLDALQARTHARGLFSLGEVSRADGSFTRPGALETLYTFEVQECVGNGAAYYVDMIFDRPTAATPPSRATRRALVRTSQWHHRDPPLVRARAGAVDEVSFGNVSGNRTWAHLAGPSAWAP